MMGDRTSKESSAAASLEESYSFCQSLTRSAARNFYFSFLGLPREEFRAMCVLYAFMRVTDDLGDSLGISVSEKAANLTDWRASLDSALDGQPGHHPVFPALAHIVQQYEIPPAYLSAVIDGIEMDLQPSGFETFEELRHYCYHVAGVVGLCCIHIWGFEDDRAVSCAEDCGLAFQLTNILRDLSEDAGMGRVYLPREDLHRFGYSFDDLLNERRNGSFQELMKFQVDRARSYYVKAEELFDYLAPSGQPILRAMLRIYGGLLNEIERRNYDVFTRTVTLPTWRKLIIAADSAIRRHWSKKPI